MSQTDDFQCAQCAKCCQNILETRGGVLRGLPLTQKETELFPEKVISPKMGIGFKDEPEVIVLYQINVNCCPYVNKQNQCQIYQKRPLMCQSFPIVAGAISNRCQVFSYRKPGVTYNEPYPMTAQLQANDKLEKYIQNRIKKHSRHGLKIWEYNLATKQWIHTHTL
ncbi:MAG: YkgJ family cysteine cluster protein [Candidatus Bathyarchaeota archaeon]|nr:YkgJ family cysteine cluster protein [Candidatus Bathyarchaeota archaeon]